MTVQISGTSGYIADFSNATVASRQAFQTSTSNGTTGIYALPNGTSTAASWQATNAADPTNASKILIATNGSTDVQLVSGINGTGTYLPLTFYTNGAEKMRLDTSGNLGLGVTPSAWYSTSSQAIQFGAGSAYSHSYSGSTGFGLSYNCYSSTQGGGWKYVANGYANIYEQSGGVHAWYNAASGTAGGTVSFTQAMTLDASGNLGVGATSITSLGSGYQTTQLQGTNGSGLLFYRGSSTQIGYFYGDSTGMSWGTSSAIPLMFLTNSTERARIDSSGNLLVGTTSASYNTIYKDNAGNWAFRVQNPSATAYGMNVYLSGSPNNTTQEGFRVEDASAIRMRVFSNGNVQNTNNSYGAISDIKLKENITDATPKLAGLMQVRVVNYNLIGDTNKQLGVVAQELEQVFPAMVDESPDLDAENIPMGTTTKSVKYSVFVPMLIKAIQEQQAIIQQLQADVEALKGKA